MVNKIVHHVPMMTPLDIKIALLRGGIPGAEISKRLGVDRTLIYHTIAGRRRGRRVREAIAKALRVPYSQVWGEDENNKAA